MTIQDAEAEKDKDEVNTDQGIVDPRSALGSSHRPMPSVRGLKDRSYFA